MNKYRITYRQEIEEEATLEVEAENADQAREQNPADEAADLDYSFIQCSDRWIESVELIEGEEPEFDISSLDLSQETWRQEVIDYRTRDGFNDWVQFKIAEARAGM